MLPPQTSPAPEVAAAAPAAVVEAAPAAAAPEPSSEPVGHAGDDPFPTLRWPERKLLTAIVHHAAFRDGTIPAAAAEWGKTSSSIFEAHIADVRDLCRKLHPDASLPDLPPGPTQKN